MAIKAALLLSAKKRPRESFFYKAQHRKSQFFAAGVNAMQYFAYVQGNLAGGICNPHTPARRCNCCTQ